MHKNAPGFFTWCLSGSLLVVSVFIPQLSIAQTPEPHFEVATIKPVDPKVAGDLGFLGYPGGRITVGAANLKMLIRYAFNVQEFQISGLPSWAGKARYDIAALPVGSSAGDPNSPPLRATPTGQERQMIQSLLVQRFGFRYHRQTQQRPIFFLERTSPSPLLEESKLTDKDPRGGVLVRADGTVDGTAFGINVSMKFLAGQLSPHLERVVLDRTGLPGTYDFRLKPEGPPGHDVIGGIIDVMSRLGLRLRPGTGPVESIVVDGATPPTEN